MFERSALLPSYGPNFIANFLVAFFGLWQFGESTLFAKAKDFFPQIGLELDEC